MALSFGNGNGFMQNAFIDEFTVNDARDVSGIQTPWGNTPDLALEVEYPAKNGNTFKQTIGGNFKMVNDKIVGWGGAFVVQSLIEKSSLFKSMDMTDRNEFLLSLEYGRIPERFLNYLKGKILHKISYVKGWKEDNPTKLAYSTFNQLGWDKEQLISSFKKGLAKGYPKNYNPTAVAGPISDTEGDTSFEPPVDDDVI